MDAFFETNRSNGKPPLKLSVTSLAKLYPLSDQIYGNGNPSNTYFIASGQDNGQVTVWKHEAQRAARYGDQRPFAALKSPLFNDAITTVSDLEGGSNHLACGDANGCILVWDYFNS